MISGSLCLCLFAAAAFHPLPRQADAPLTGAAVAEHVAVLPSAQGVAAYVTTVLVPSLPDTSARAVIIRRPQGTTTLNVILVTAETTPRDFLKAVAILNRARRSQSDVVSQELRASVMPMKGAGAERGNGHSEAEQHLAQLRATAPLDLPGIGRHPSLTTSLPAVR